MFSALELKVPPPAVAALCALAMWGIDRLWPQAHVTTPYAGIVASIVALAGGAIALLGVAAFRQARTTISPVAPGDASTLVTGGIYGVTRNPMYLGTLLLLTGWALYLGNFAAWAMPVAFVLYMNRCQIAPEERALAQLFGMPFENYRARVRRWL